MKYRHAYIAVLAVLSALALTNCAQNPVTGRQNFVMMSESDEVRMGAEADKEIKEEYGAYDHAKLQAYVNQVGQRTARSSHRPELNYQFTVLDSPDINAFALPGGYVYITRGILSYLNSEAELAAVLGHEIGHVTARHSVRQYSATQAANIGLTLGSILIPQLGSQGGQTIANLLGTAILNGYGRDHELEADRLGAEYLARAEYNPNAMMSVITVLKDQELFDAEVAKREGRAPRSYHGLFSTHPSNDARLKQVIAEGRSHTQGKNEENSAAYLNQISGMWYGDSPKQGFIRGANFYHEDLGFAVQFPQGWRIQNRPDRVVAASTAQDGLISLHIQGKAAGTPSDFLRRHFKFDSATQIHTDELNGLPAAIATGTMKGTPVRMAVIYLQDKAYVIATGAKSVAIFNRYSDALSATIKSFHALTQAERARLKPMVLKTITAKPGMTFSELAKQSPLGPNAEGYLRLMNRAYPKGEPRPNQILKVVE